MRGFAVTMALGIAISMFTAVAVVRALMGLYLRLRRPRQFVIGSLLPQRWLAKTPNFPFMRARFVGLGLSIVLSVASIALFFKPGLNYGVDFTGGTLIEVVRALEREGVEEMYACATHGVLSDPAIDRIRDSALREVVITDSIPLPAAKRLSKITVLSVAPLFGEAIKRIHRGESVGALFSSEVRLVEEMTFWDEAAEDDEDEGEATEPQPFPVSASG